MNSTEMQYYHNIGKSNKFTRMECFTFIDYYGNLNDHLRDKKVDPYAEGFELTQYVVDILMPFVLARVKDPREYKLTKIVLSNVYDTYII